jgi:hydrogenase maturation protease
MSECDPPREVVVLGVGNELYRDEGVGVLVARELAQGPLPADVRVVEGAVGGLDLLWEMEQARHVIIVDAAEMDERPGAIRVFAPDDVEMMRQTQVASLHQIGLTEVLEFGKLMQVRPKISIVGIQPEIVAPGFELSETVAEALPRAVEIVRGLFAPAAV